MSYTGLAGRNPHGRPPLTRPNRLSSRPRGAGTSGRPGRPSGHAGLGATATGDFVDVFAAQKNDARRAFGNTGINLPGRTDVQYPQVSGAYALQVLNYWKTEALRLLGHASAIPDSAHRSAWLRAVQNLNSPNMIFFAGVAKGAGDNLVAPETLSAHFWDDLTSVVIPMAAIKATPTTWTLIKQSIDEAYHEAVKPFESGISSLLNKLLLFGGALFVLHLLIGRDR